MAPQLHSSARADRIVLAAIAAATVLVLSLLLALSRFAHPSADDFCLAVKTLALGFGDAQAWWYANWTGRFVSTALISAFTVAADLLRLYAVAAVIVLALTSMSFACLVHCIVRDRCPRSVVLLAAGSLTVLHFSAAPDVAQTFYWLTGSFTYQLGNVFFVLLIALLIRKEQQPAARRLPTPLAFIAMALLTVAAVGSNEVTLLLTLAVLSAGTLLAFRLPRSRASRLSWTGLLVIGVAGALASVLAPGNWTRAAGVQGDGQLRPDAWAAVIAFVPWTMLRFSYWLSNVALWASAFIVLRATAPICRRWIYAGGAFDRRLYWVPISWIAILLALNAVGFAINRYPLPERAESVVALAFVLGWYPSFVILAHRVFGERVLAGDRWQLRAAAALIVVGTLGSPAVFEAYKDVYRGYRYDREMRERFVTLERHRGERDKDVLLGSLSRPPRTLFATDIVTDATNFRNSCPSDYFGVRSVRLGAPPR